MYQLKKLPSTRSHIIRNWDGFYESSSDEFSLGEFDIRVFYTIGDLGSDFHPYGMGYAEEVHGLEIEILRAETIKPVEVWDIEGNNVLFILLPKMDVTKIPGWNEGMWDSIQKEIDELDHYRYSNDID